MYVCMYNVYVRMYVCTYVYVYVYVYVHGLGKVESSFFLMTEQEKLFSCNKYYVQCYCSQ